MPYIGNQPAEQFTSFATQEFSTSATTSYTLDHAVTNENEIALFVNNVRQQPGSGKAYTATGTALTLSAATASTDTMYCVFLGRALQTVTPSTNSITSSMLGSNFFTGATDVGGAIADADLFLMDDGAGGTLRKTAASRIKTYVGGGLTEADQFRISTTTSTPSSTVSDLTANWERVDTDGFGKIGTGMSESSGIFSFPSTGTYYIHAFACFQGSSASYYNLVLKTTTDNSTYDLASENYCFTQDSSDYQSTSLTFMFNVTNTSTHKLKFGHRSASSGGSLQGQSAANANAFTFIRLGDST